MKKILFLSFLLVNLAIQRLDAKGDVCLNQYSATVNEAQDAYYDSVRSIGDSFLTGGTNPAGWFVQYRDLERARVSFYNALDSAATSLCWCDQAWCS